MSEATVLFIACSLGRLRITSLVLPGRITPSKTAMRSVSRITFMEIVSPMMVTGYCAAMGAGKVSK